MWAGSFLRRDFVRDCEGTFMSKYLKALSVFAVINLYLVLLQGALVTNSGSADGCGESWPLCHGTFMPEWDYEAIIEFSHRAVAGLAGLVVIALAIWAWRALPGRRLVQWLGGLSVFSIIFQGLLGAAAVVWPQPKAVLALHFGISLVCFSAVLLLAVLIFREDRKAGRSAPPVAGTVRWWVWGTAIVTYGVVYLGALVRHLRASLACFGWPLCNGELIPTLTGPVAASFAHRLGAVLCLVLVVLMFRAIRQGAPERKDMQRVAAWTLVLLVAQILEGALLSLGYLNLLTQMLHSAIITGFWGVLSVLCIQVVPDAVLDATDGRPASAARPAPLA